MKYADTKVKGISRKTLAELEKIAMKAAYTLEVRGGIESRDCDYEDYRELSVNAIQAMLEQAYLLGKKEAIK